jgi:hypothetical protein
VPAVALTGILFLTFFAWVGTFPAGYRLFTQNPWQALFGWISLEDRFDQTLRELPALQAEVSGNWLLLLYFPLLLAAVAVAWADRTGLTPEAHRLPTALAGVARLWPHRLTLLTTLSALALVLIVIQSARGFGLQTAIEARIAAAIAAAEAAPNPQALPYLHGEQIGHFGLGGTTARDFALTLHAVTVLALFARLWLEARGAKPLPKMTAYW